MTAMGGSGSPTFELLYSQHTQDYQTKKYLEWEDLFCFSKHKISSLYSPG